MCCDLSISNFDEDSLHLVDIFAYFHPYIFDRRLHFYLHLGWPAYQPVYPLLVLFFPSFALRIRKLLELDWNWTRNGHWMGLLYTDWRFDFPCLDCVLELPERKSEGR